MNNDKLLRVEHEVSEDIFNFGCDCDTEGLVRIESEISIYEPVGKSGINALEYKTEHITETCKTCGSSRDYETEPEPA